MLITPAVAKTLGPGPATIPPPFLLLLLLSSLIISSTSNKGLCLTDRFVLQRHNKRHRLVPVGEDPLARGGTAPG